MSYSALRMQRACRAHLLTLAVASAVGRDVYVTTAGYVRQDGGSWLDDGYAVGMEIEATAFDVAANNGTKLISGLTDDTLSVVGGTSAERGPSLFILNAADGDLGDGVFTRTGEARFNALADAPPPPPLPTIALGLPSSRAWENVKFDPAPGTPYIAERWLGGPVTLTTLPYDGFLEATPQYQVMVYTATNIGMDAASSYGDAILRHFRPGTTITDAAGIIARVRADTGPFRTSLALDTPGWSVLSLTIPLRVETRNI